GMRACHTNNCPVGIASMKDHLRARFEIEKSAARLENFFHGSTELMKILARACGHTSFKNFSPYDLVTWKKEMHHLSGVEFAGVN
ncbi:MAG TPA: glutamate synthase, partial [Balneola sp.]|nr:glutamate synthase [Balneola sp.]